MTDQQLRAEINRLEKELARTEKLWRQERETRRGLELATLRKPGILQRLIRRLQ